MSELIRDLHLFADGQEIGQGCRIRLTARETLSLLPQLFDLEIENLSDPSSVFLASAGKLEVQSHGSVLASGAVMDVCPRRQSGRKILSVTFSPGFGLWQSSVSLSLRSGMKVSDSVRAVLAAAVLPDRTAGSVPLAAFSAEDARITRPQSFFGRTCDALRLLAETVNADAYLSPAGLCIVGHANRTPALFLPEDTLFSDPVFLKDRIILSTSVTGWPLGACAELTLEGGTYQGPVVSRLLQLDSASGIWMNQLEILTGDV